MKQPPNGRYALDILWVGLLMLYVLAGRSVVPFHGDESAQIAMSVDYSYLFIERDYSKILYSNEPYNPIEQGLRLENAGLNRYLIGLSWHLAGFSPDDLNAPWWWSQDYDFNMNNNYYPGDALLLVGRIPASLLTAGGVLLVFLIGMKLQGTTTAYIASLFYGLHPAILVSGRRAIKEGGHIFFGLFTLLAGIWFINTLATPSEKRRVPLWVNILLLGVISGLAIASKHTNVMLVGTVYMSLGLYTIFHARQKLIRISIYLLIAGLFTAGTYVVLHPAWWGNPIERAGQVAQGRLTVLTDQVDTFQISYDNDIRKKVAGFWQHVFTGGSPQYFEAQAWANYIPNQIDYYETTPLTGFSPSWLGIFLFIAMFPGYAVLLGRLNIGTRNQGAQWVIGTWAFVILIFSVFIVPMGWQRYYIPFFPVLGITVSLGIIWMMKLINTTILRLKIRE